MYGNGRLESEDVYQRLRGLYRCQAANFLVLASQVGSLTGTWIAVGLATTWIPTILTPQRSICGRDPVVRAWAP